MRFTSGGVDASPDWTGVLWRGHCGQRLEYDAPPGGVVDQWNVLYVRGARDERCRRGGFERCDGDAGAAAVLRPAILTGAVGDGTVRLTWSDPVDATITGYELEYGDAEGVAQAWAPITTGDAGATSYTVRGSRERQGIHVSGCVR